VRFSQILAAISPLPRKKKPAITITGQISHGEDKAFLEFIGDSSSESTRFPLPIRIIAMISTAVPPTRAVASRRHIEHDHPNNIDYEASGVSIA
jgi:hypothetical protein